MTIGVGENGVLFAKLMMFGVTQSGVRLEQSSASGLLLFHTKLVSNDGMDRCLSTESQGFLKRAESVLHGRGSFVIPSMVTQSHRRPTRCDERILRQNGKASVAVEEEDYSAECDLEARSERGVPGRLIPALPKQVGKLRRVHGIASMRKAPHHPRLHPRLMLADDTSRRSERLEGRDNGVGVMQRH